jgi:hypothetical protein
MKNVATYPLAECVLKSERIQQENSREPCATADKMMEKVAGGFFK